MMEYIKICGLKKMEDIALSIENGAKAIGFIYNIPSSPRNLSRTEINSLLQNLSNKVLTVAVSNPRNMIELKNFVENIPVDYYQIHSDLDEKELELIPRELKERIILALKVTRSNKEEVIRKINMIHSQFFAFLIDNSEGHGNNLNINLIKELLDKIKKAKVIIAGGISVNNIEEILKILNPFGIDVSSSLESEKGVKDPLRIKNFLQKVKETIKKLRE